MLSDWTNVQLMIRPNWEIAQKAFNQKGEITQRKTERKNDFRKGGSANFSANQIRGDSL